MNVEIDQKPYGSTPIRDLIQGGTFIQETHPFVLWMVTDLNSQTSGCPKRYVVCVDVATGKTQSFHDSVLVTTMDSKVSSNRATRI